VRLIGRNHDLIGQLLKGLENEETKEKKRRKRKVLSKQKYKEGEG